MASALAHVSLLGLVILFSEVHPFGTVTAQSIAVDLVTPDEIAKPEEVARKDENESPSPPPSPQLPKEDTPSPSEPAATASPPPAPPEKQQDAVRPASRETAAGAQPQPPPQAPSTPAPATPSPQQQAQPAYTPPEPDLTVKYNVMLGLPEAPPPLASSSGDKPGDGIDANASSAANISSSLVAKFREHLKTCAKLPASVARSDNVFVKLRVVMTPKARLAAEPVLIEGTASMKGLELKQSAVRALSACQPFDMLPVDRYGEWKVLDLSFSPQDFS